MTISLDSHTVHGCASTIRPPASVESRKRPPRTVNRDVVYMRISTATASQDFCEDLVKSEWHHQLLMCLQSRVSESPKVKGQMKVSM